MRVREQVKCRYYDLVMTKEEVTKHFKVLAKLEMIYGGIQIGGSRSGPLIDENMRASPDRFNLVFQLAEGACPEYEKAMRITR